MSSLPHGSPRPFVGETSGDLIWTIDRDGRFTFLATARAGG
jgi:hypothetical protein